MLQAKTWRKKVSKYYGGYNHFWTLANFHLKLSIQINIYLLHVVFYWVWYEKIGAFISGTKKTPIDGWIRKWLGQTSLRDRYKVNENLHLSHACSEGYGWFITLWVLTVVYWRSFTRQSQHFHEVSVNSLQFTNAVHPPRVDQYDDLPAPAISAMCSQQRPVEQSLVVAGQSARGSVSAYFWVKSWRTLPRHYSAWWWQHFTHLPWQRNGTRMRCTRKYSRCGD